MKIIYFKEGNMTYSKPVTEIIQKRFSCRTYARIPIEDKKKQKIDKLISELNMGPLGNPVRFCLIAGTEQDRNTLKGLGTYGFIRGMGGFIIGAVRSGEKDLEDYGYAMERIVLLATEQGLGTCWLGGSFSRSSFAKKILLKDEECLPAVVSIGYIADPEHAKKAFFRKQIGADTRLQWDKLFFNKNFNVTLKLEDAGGYETPLKMLRLAPSASNKQPWRVVKDGNIWHFYMQRSKGYRDNIITRFLKIADLQRVDMGIAMCHFELTANELGIKGKWVVNEPAIEKPDNLMEYTVSWKEQNNNE